ncbi:hypothetical protein B0H34DRAFT_678511 [Crassisporium funariophilum]|nr:hypothetical protein B0H34DRAFT_678511 [Crassisporium funariophilum]
MQGVRHSRRVEVISERKNLKWESQMPYLAEFQGCVIWDNSCKKPGRLCRLLYRIVFKEDDMASGGIKQIVSNGARKEHCPDLLLAERCQDEDSTKVPLLLKRWHRTGCGGALETCLGEGRSLWVADSLEVTIDLNREVRKLRAGSKCDFYHLFWAFPSTSRRKQ